MNDTHEPFPFVLDPGDDLPRPSEPSRPGADESRPGADGSQPGTEGAGRTTTSEPQASGPRDDDEALDVLAPQMALAYGLEHLERDASSPLIDLARLPSWPTRTAPRSFTQAGDVELDAGHGIGFHLARRLGLGLRPGELVAVGAAHAGAGKTAWLMQLADGLSLRNLAVLGEPLEGRGATSWTEILTPVFLVSEMSVEALTWRTLARWTGHPAYLLRAGRTGLARDGEAARQAWAAARSALAPDSPLQRARCWQRRLSSAVASEAAAKGPAVLVRLLARQVERWREDLARAHPKQDIVPIVVLDPLQRWQSGRADEVADLNTLVRALATQTEVHRWVTLVTSDTNKASAKGDNASHEASEEGAAVFRGSYSLIHEASAALYLRRPPTYEPSDDDARSHQRHAEMVLVKSRWGDTKGTAPRYRWQIDVGRFWPMPAEEADRSTRQDRKTATPPASRGKARKPASPPSAIDIERERNRY